MISKPGEGIRKMDMPVDRSPAPKNPPEEPVEEDLQDEDMSENDEEEAEPAPRPPVGGLLAQPVNFSIHGDLFPYPENITINTVIDKTLAVFGFVPVDKKVVGDDIHILCRAKIEDTVLLKRIGVLLHTAGSAVEVFKKYLLKDGRLVFGWYLVVHNPAIFHDAAVKAAKHVKVTVTKVDLGTGGPIIPLGKDAAKGEVQGFRDSDSPSIKVAKSAGVIPGIGVWR